MCSFYEIICVREVRGNQSKFSHFSSFFSYTAQQPWADLFQERNVKKKKSLKGFFSSLQLVKRREEQSKVKIFFNQSFSCCFHMVYTQLVTKIKYINTDLELFGRDVQFLWTKEVQKSGKRKIIYKKEKNHSFPCSFSLMCYTQWITKIKRSKFQLIRIKA